MKPPIQNGSTLDSKILTNLVTTKHMRLGSERDSCGSGNSLMDKRPCYGVSPGVRSVEKGVEIRE